MANFIVVPHDGSYTLVNLDHIVSLEVSDPDYQGLGGGTRINLTGGKSFETGLELQHFALAIKKADGSVTPVERRDD